MTYLDNLRALRDAMIARMTANAGVASYGLDGESWSALPLGDLEVLQKLILMEENRVPGRRELRVVRGRRLYGGYR